MKRRSQGSASGPGYTSVTPPSRPSRNACSNSVEVASDCTDDADSRNDCPMHPSGGLLGTGRRTCGYQLLNAFHDVAHRADILHLFIRHIDVEFIFEREDDVHGIHGVDTQLFEAAVDSDQRHVLSLVIGNDAEYSGLRLPPGFIRSGDIAVERLFQNDILPRSAQEQCGAQLRGQQTRRSSRRVPRPSCRQIIPPPRTRDRTRSAMAVAGSFQSRPITDHITPMSPSFTCMRRKPNQRTP